MILGIGTDITAARRICPDSISFDDPFFARSFTERERDEAQNYPDRRSYFTGRFAAKEAVFKAISACCCDFRPGDIETLNDVSGKPWVSLIGKTAETYSRYAGNNFEILISISYEKDFAVAYVIIQIK